MTDETTQFLHALFDDVDEALYVLVWTLPDKQSRWFRADQLDTIAAAVEHDTERDVYVGVGLSTKDRGKRNRVESKDVAGIVGMWIDVDIADDEAHTKSNLPPDEDTARKIIDSVGAAPTVVIHSGHGLQAWWLFDEPWIFTDVDDHAAAQALATRWNLTVRVRAAELGYVLDATQDLARVMRLPGTINNKAAAVPVRILGGKKWLGPRWGVSALDDYLADERAMSLLSGRRTHIVGDVDLVDTAEVSMTVFDALCANDSKFKASWDRTRKDMADDSASSYDLSIATIAAGAGLSDQQIADLIIASRRKHGDDPAKSLRRDYIGRTIGKARDDHARVYSSQEIESATQRIEHADDVGDPGEKVHAVREMNDHLSNVLRVECTRWVKYMSTPARYRLETPAGAVMLGTSEDVLNQVKMRARIADATKIVIPRFKTPRWDEIAQAIFAACEEEDVGTESTDEGTAFAWIVEYLQDRPLAIVDDDHVSLSQVCETMTPYTSEGSTFVFGPHFRRWLHVSRGDRVTAARMGEVLRSFGCEPSIVHTRIGGARTTRSVWRVPSLDGDVDDAGPLVDLDATVEHDDG